MFESAKNSDYRLACSRRFFVGFLIVVLRVFEVIFDHAVVASTRLPVDCDHGSLGTISNAKPVVERLIVAATVVVLPSLLLLIVLMIIIWTHKLCVRSIVSRLHLDWIAYFAASSHDDSPVVYTATTLNVRQLCC